MTMSPDRTKRLWLLATIASCGAILSVELLLPLNWDNWVYQTMGWDLLAYGKLPYVGSWDVNLPGIVYLHALAIAIFGRSDLGFRVFQLVLEVGSMWMFFRILRRFIPPAQAALSCLIYCLLYTSLGWSAAGQRDSFALFFLYAGLEILLECLPKTQTPAANWRLKAAVGIASGLFISFPIIIRPTYLMFPICVFAVVAIPKGLRDVALSAGLAIGIVSALALLLLPYALTPSGLSDFWTTAIRYNLDLYTRQAPDPLGTFLRQRVTFECFTILVTLGLMVLLWKTLAKRRQTPTEFAQRSDREIPRSVRITYVLLIASSLISVIAMRKYYDYHFLPFMALLSPIAAEAILMPRLVINRKWQAATISILFCGFLLLQLFPRNYVRNYLDGLKDTTTALRYAYERVDTDSSCGFRAEQEAVDFLNRKNPTRDRIEVMAFNRPYLRVQCGLSSTTRFTEFQPLVILAADSILRPYQLDWRREYIERIQSLNPLYIVAVDNGTNSLIGVPPIVAATTIPRFSDVLRKNYALDTIIHGFTFYRRR